MGNFFFKSLSDLSFQKRTCRGETLNTIIPITKLSKDSIYYWTLLDFNLFDQNVEYFWSLKHNASHCSNGNNIDFYILFLWSLYFVLVYAFTPERRSWHVEREILLFSDTKSYPLKTFVLCACGQNLFILFLITYIVML